jgi:hypothetical protein
MAPCGGRTAQLNAGAIWKRCGQERMFPVNPLMADPGDLFGQALQQLIINTRMGNALHGRLSGILDPDFPGAIDQNFSYALALKPVLKGGKISLQIDAFRIG